MPDLLPIGTWVEWTHEIVVLHMGGHRKLARSNISPWQSPEHRHGVITGARYAREGEMLLGHFEDPVRFDFHGPAILVYLVRRGMLNREIMVPVDAVMVLLPECRDDGTVNLRQPPLPRLWSEQWHGKHREANRNTAFTESHDQPRDSLGQWVSEEATDADTS